MGFKQAHRRDDDIAIVNAGFFVRARGKKVDSFRATYGGMAATAVSATHTEKSLLGRQVDETVTSICFYATLLKTEVFKFATSRMSSNFSHEILTAVISTTCYMTTICLL